jgi:predicted XRE-type DNA-binding protein
MRVDRELQAQLARELLAILDGWSATHIVEHLGLYPARVSELRRGNLARFSIGRLVRLIAALRFDIEITLRPTPPPRPARRQPSASVVRRDRFGR